jgi:hypothetical protein
VLGITSIRSKYLINGIIKSHNITPQIQAQILSIIDSNKNIFNISLVLIHTAFSIHISFVLSATQANITFIIHIPDTTSTIIATQVKSNVIVRADSLAAVTFDHWSTTLKSSESEALNLCSSLSIVPNSVIAKLILSTSLANAIILGLELSHNIDWTVK